MCDPGGNRYCKELIGTRYSQAFAAFRQRLYRLELRFNPFFADRLRMFGQRRGVKQAQCRGISRFEDRALGKHFPGMKSVELHAEDPVRAFCVCLKQHQFERVGGTRALPTEFALSPHQRDCWRPSPLAHSGMIVLQVNVSRSKFYASATERRIPCCWIFVKRYAEKDVKQINKIDRNTMELARHPLAGQTIE